MEVAVRAFIKHTNMLSKGQHVVIAVSGGPDSMALLHFLWQERRHYGIHITAAHINHQLRGDESNRDEELVRDFCLKEGIPCEFAAVDVKGYAKRNQMGSSVAARELRYQALLDILKRVNGNCLAVAHHGDDQIETVFMKLVRSANALQIPGIEASRMIGDVPLIRPLLGVTKADILQYCVNYGIQYALDSSNTSTVYTRNRFRETVLPFVTHENPMLFKHIQRYHEWQSEDQAFLFSLAEEQLSQILIKKSEQIVTISRDQFLSVALPLQRRVIHLILNYLYNESARITSVHIEQTITMLRAENPSASLELANGAKLLREYDHCHFLLVPSNVKEQPPLMLDIPGKVVLHLGEVSANWVEQETKQNHDPHIQLDGDELKLPLTVRASCSGDRIAALGMAGTKKLNRLFIDRKVPRSLRSEWPVVVDSHEQIIWVPLLQRSRLAKVTSSTKNIVELTFYGDTKRLLEFQ
ncbi:tRNA lysidine(34) synthetase TilS [Alkalicoccobacillus murimartini]|uniref:tRNA(Ile)-lysidine synthase n=1 Tax=Alkalicoccobacillus murimartini TaxID=171685 RepID=A0ABT9YMZ2_9BACI|nr:tRNA lysidine(34) synthetase TilS [Alkalicoccobacillus murimartini]MDQ0209222.1 tRNA(Ile)-lysidine synthase [Alkalicoccobacillus murimartini]